LPLGECRAVDLEPEGVSSGSVIAARRTESNMTNFLPGSGNHEIDQRGNELFVVAIGVIVIVLGLILMAIVLQAGGVVPHL
jgi:hypothetical protein